MCPVTISRSQPFETSLFWSLSYGDRRFVGVGFEGFGLELPLLQAVREMGFDEIFPIQAKAIAPLLEGRDLMGQAHTGAGKTLAFALPMLQKADRRTPGIQGLVIVPTRELALQVAREFEKLAKHL